MCCFINKICSNLVFHCMKTTEILNFFNNFCRKVRYRFLCVCYIKRQLPSNFNQCYTRGLTPKIGSVKLLQETKTSRTMVAFKSPGQRPNANQTQADADEFSVNTRPVTGDVVGYQLVMAPVCVLVGGRKTRRNGPETLSPGITHLPLDGKPCDHCRPVFTGSV